eukprot:TRINITY_DN80555_c0_g1_i1.p2 TRINITY_DN80555_c0_g1~~TRINITY_DN80555_c0_g1_i1.p2  ORF type:complete len:352 (+),score=88.44 TRINITY_DN80555_c0_g1_i1:66-1058(+)
MASEAAAAAPPAPADAAAEKKLVVKARGPVAAVGDFVVLWGTYSQVAGIVLVQGGIYNSRYGSFHHEDLIGKPFGSKVLPRRGGDRWLAMLRPSPELITQSVSHRTQIIYHADISLLLALLDARPGKIIVESGTGSGSVSASFARAVSPGGKLHTFEFHAERQQKAAEDFKKYGLEDAIVSKHGDACQDGFGEDLRNAVDGVFLDLPAPWSALPHVDACLVEGGKLVTFSPCIEQIDRTANELRRMKYQNIRMWETLAVNWGVREEHAGSKKRRIGNKGSGKSAPGASDSTNAAAKAEANQPVSWVSHQLPMRGHTGFLMVSTKAPQDEP